MLNEKKTKSSCFIRLKDVFLVVEKVILTKVQKHLKKLPIHIVRNLQRWAMQTETLGLAEVRKIPGYHDEPLLGSRKGQRSVRLS